MKLNLHDPRMRQRVLLGGAAFGLLAAIIWRRSSSSTTPAAVGTTIDPTALDPAALTNGLPSSLGGGGGFDTGVTASDQAADVGSLTSAITDAVASIQDAVSTLFTAPQTDPYNGFDVTPPAPQPDLPFLGRGYGPGGSYVVPGFSTDAQGKLIPYGSVVTPTAVVTAAPASPSARALQIVKQSSSSAPVNTPPTSSVARSTPVVVAPEARVIVPVGKAYAA